jgi:hypothetical protein
MNLFCPSLMGSIESCGCFGELIHFSPLSSFVKSVALWVMSIGYCALCVRDMRKMSLKAILKDCKMYVTLIAGTLPPLYSYLCFEKIEHGWYIAGYIVLCIMGEGMCYKLFSFFLKSKMVISKDRNGISE